MTISGFNRNLFSICAAVALLAGCGGLRSPSGAEGMIPQGVAPGVFSTALQDAGVSPVVLLPPACKGQKKTKQYANVTEALTKSGSLLCIPGFGGFGGTMLFPGVTIPVKATLISSTTNYANVPPPKASGSPIFYLNLAPAAATMFGTKLRSGGGLTSKKIKAKASYTGYIEGYRSGFWFEITSCYNLATSGKYGGVIGGLGALLKGLQGTGFSGYSDFEIFVYAGQYGGSKC